LRVTWRGTKLSRDLYNFFINLYELYMTGPSPKGMKTSQIKARFF
jgi:hypothetical protein